MSHSVESDALTDYDRLWTLGLVHALTCPIRSRWRKRRYGQPYWRNDNTAHSLGIGRFGCKRCGKGAIEERNYTRPTPPTETHP